MGSKWKKVKMLLGLHVCAMARPEPPEEELSPIDASDVDFLSTASLVIASPAMSTSHSAPATPSLSPPRLNSTRNSSIRLLRSTCSICLESMKPGYGHALFTAECSHTFHFSCIASNVRYGNLVCPVCRAKWKEVPWQAPVEACKSEKLTRVSSHSRRSASGALRASLQAGRADASDATASEGQRRLDPVLRILDENIASARGHWQSFPLEPNVYNDDEPLASGGVVEGEQTRGGEGTSDCELNKSMGRPTEAESKGRMVKITTYPEVSGVRASEVLDSFTVLVHLKAPCIQKLDHGRERSTDPFQVMRATLRAPIDLITVLDISGSMAGTKLALVKRAMGFVIRNLSSVDRLSIVAFSSTARRILPLRTMVEEGRQQALRAIDGLMAIGGTNITEGLRKGAKVLEDRRERNPISSIMLLSDGQDTYSMGTRRQLPFPLPRGVTDYLRLVPGSIRHSSRYGHGQIPVHTFGFGADHDADTMHSIAEVSGGTFSFIQAEGAVQDAFAQCIGGLLSVVIQDVQMMISCCAPGVQLQTIRAGSYESSVLDSAKRGLIKLGDLYAEEERDVLLELKLPSIPQSHGQLDDRPVLQVGCMFRDPVTQELIHTPAHELCISRPTTVHREQQVTSLEVDRQRNRLLTTDAITEARSLADREDMAAAQLTLQVARTRLGSSPCAQAGDQLCSVLEAELAEIQGRMTNRQLYERSGRAYLLSAESSHLRQRATTRGESVGGHSTDYQTPSMVDMILRSQTLSSPTACPLNSNCIAPSRSSSMRLVSRATHSLLRRPSRKLMID